MTFITFLVSGFGYNGGIQGGIMNIGGFVARALRAEGFEFKASDRVNWVNWQLQEAGSFLYIGFAEDLKSFAIFERDY